MDMPLPMTEQDADALIAAMGARARAAATILAAAPTAIKADALVRAAALMRDRAGTILAANAEDMARATASGMAPAMLDRLKLDTGRLEGIAAALEAVSVLPDPVGIVIDSSERPNGLALSRVRVPLGVVGIIYESRPNVTA
ncbi:MAG: glutamate-5-semialdehyde dehydrogenase, partial [Sphingomonas bacterium]|nr:glutamate-5-semialdehyde dehydrogenase [Sphingomonas bacterium]